MPNLQDVSGLVTGLHFHFRKKGPKKENLHLMYREDYALCILPIPLDQTVKRLIYSAWRNFRVSIEAIPDYWK